MKEKLNLSVFNIFKTILMTLIPIAILIVCALPCAATHRVDKGYIYTYYSLYEYMLITWSEKFFISSVILIISTFVLVQINTLLIFKNKAVHITISIISYLLSITALVAAIYLVYLSSAPGAMGIRQLFFIVPLLLLIPVVLAIIDIVRAIKKIVKHKR